MFKQKTETPVHIPDEALHLATDSQITRNLRAHGHEVKTRARFVVATHKDTKATVAWTPTPGCEPQPLFYRAQIIRALVRLGFFLVLALIVIHFAGLL